VGALSCSARRACATALGVAGVVAMGGAVASRAVPASEPLVVRTSIAPTVQFGDALSAHVVVLMDRSSVDSHRLRITASVAPLTQLAATHTSRFSRGPLDVVTFELSAACLDQHCLPGEAARMLRLPAVTAEVPTRGGSVASVTQPWPKLTIRGRVAGPDLERSRLPFRTNLDPPSVTYRITPDTLGTLLGVVAAAFGVTAIVLAAAEALRIRRRRRVFETTELQQALELARSAETRSPEDRRRAVGLLARLLHPREERLAGTASTLAWSAPEPTPDSVSSLVDRIAQEVEAT